MMCWIGNESSISHLNNIRCSLQSSTDEEFDKIILQYIAQVSFDSPATPSIPTIMDKGYYRQVPYRFFTNQSETDTCKLEKLTNLFPDMKSTIELELFKINNLSRTIDRLSRIYTVLTAMDIRDDTVHLFLGPYHLSLGPALFAALHFKTASAALLVSARPPSSAGIDDHRRKRRREAVLRRFRRAVRKLTLVKSIIDQLRPASILTPYNQYELHTHGIYDLVLAGRPTNCDLMFDDENFLEQLHHLDSMQASGERSPLLASNFIKINNILNLLSSAPSSQSGPTPTPSVLENTATLTEKIVQTNGSESTPGGTSSNETRALMNSIAACCPQHRHTSPFIMFPIRPSLSPQASQYLPSSGLRSRQNSNPNMLKTPSVLSRQSTTNSLSDSNGAENSSSNPVEEDLNTPTNLIVEPPFQTSTVSSSPSTTNEEDTLISRISALLTNHLLSRQSTVATASTASAQGTGRNTLMPIGHEHETNSNLSDSAISLSTGGLTPAVNLLALNNPSSSSPTLINHDFDRLLQRIRTAVDNRLSIEINSNNRLQLTKKFDRNLSLNPTQSKTQNRRQQLLALHAVSCQETHTDDYDIEHSNAMNSNQKLDLTMKSQSFDASNLNNHDVTTAVTTTTTFDISNHIYEMTTFQLDNKGVQTDPRIRHARSKLIETLQPYLTAVNRYRQHLFNQYSQSNSYYEQHYTTMPELQQYEYRDLINVRKEILHRFDWVSHELEQIIESLQARRLSVADAQQRIDRPLVKEVIESSLNADLPPPVDEHQTKPNERQRPMPNEEEWRMYARDLQDTKEDLYFIDSLVHRGISKIDRLVTFTNLYS